MKPQSRGQKVTNKDDGIENQLNEKIVNMWEAQKHVSRYIIFGTVLYIDFTLKVSGGTGGKDSADHLVRLRKWFYFGFKIWYSISNWKISSVGQKLPINWEKHLEDIQKLVVYKQVPHKIDMGYGEMEQVPGIDKKYWYNFDRIPIWQKPVGNHSWGPKESDRINVKTGGKDKDRFTVVLTLLNRGKTFTIFKDLSLL